MIKDVARTKIMFLMMHKQKITSGKNSLDVCRHMHAISKTGLKKTEIEICK